MSNPPFFLSKILHKVDRLIVEARSADPDNIVRISREARRLYNIASRASTSTAYTMAMKLLLYIRRRLIYYASRFSDPWLLGRIYTAADVLDGVIDVTHVKNMLEEKARRLRLHIMRIKKKADYDARQCAIKVFIDKKLEEETQCMTRPRILQQVENPDPEKIYKLIIWMEPGRDEIVFIKLRREKEYTPEQNGVDSAHRCERNA